ncbi:hypothetical protein [Rhodococcus sp. (in: high G+C Gram-positive bacteria)]
MKLNVQVPNPVQAEIKKLRTQAARYRNQRNDARREVESLRAELEIARNA